ncbi:MAG: hypothetical protein PHV17_02270 [Candidatus Omnitrophica bacterium]|nr:hypothetical protein [Candidatus Omnitrophota bacterium]
MSKISKRLKIGLLAGLLFMVIGLFPGTSKAEGLFDKLNFDVDVSASLDFYSDYVWRGFVLDRDPVIQPGISISALGFTYSFWSSFDTDNNSAATSSDEIDYVLDYTKSISDSLSVSVGHTYYDFPDAATYSKEFYLGLALSKVPVLDLPIETSFTYYRDYGSAPHGGGLGHYFSFDASYSTVIVEDPEISLDYGLHYGYNRKLFINGTNGSDLGLSLGLTVPLTESLTMSPTLNYSMPFGDLKDDNDGNQDDRFYIGLSLAYAL